MGQNMMRFSVVLSPICEKNSAGVMKNILLVDDDLDLSEVISDLLEEQGFKVSRCQNGDEALRKLGNFRPALMILDGNMPVLGGIEVLKRISLIPDLANLPIILMSAESLPAEEIKYPNVEFVKKPIKFEDLMARISSRLG